MIVKKLKVNNFKSIYDDFEIDFSNINGFWRISGPVGSGKTSIGEAIIFGLFGTINGKNNNDLISWGKKHGCVELWCESNNHDIYIKRELNAYGQSPIYILIDNEELIFTNKRDAQDKLENEYYDTSKMILELLCIISFNNFKSLASLNTTDTKKFLDQVLGFYILTEYSDICKRLKNDNFTNIKNCNDKINEKQSLIKKLKELSEIEVITGNINEVKDEIKINKDKLSKIITDNQVIKNNLLSQISELNSKISSVITLGKTKAKEIEFIKKGICPTCGAKIDDSSLNDKILEKQILSEQYKNLNNQLKEIEKKLNDFYIKESKEVKIKQDCISDLETKLIKLEEQSKRIDINDKQILELEKEIYNLSKSCDVYKKEDAEWTELLDILSNDIRAKILSNFIPVLNDNIQKYSRLLQLPYVIQFDDSFKCGIELYGLNEKIPISSLSTGQLKTVDMVIILGVLGTILGSSGINIIFLDELFSNLDGELRENMCNVLKQTISDDKTVFIISHQDINSQVFSGTMDLKLEKTSGFEYKTKISINKYK